MQKQILHQIKVINWTKVNLFGKWTMAMADSGTMKQKTYTEFSIISQNSVIQNKTITKRKS